MPKEGMLMAGLMLLCVGLATADQLLYRGPRAHPAARGAPRCFALDPADRLSRLSHGYERAAQARPANRELTIRGALISSH